MLQSVYFDLSYLELISHIRILRLVAEAFLSQISYKLMRDFNCILNRPVSQREYRRALLLDVHWSVLINK